MSITYNVKGLDGFLKDIGNKPKKMQDSVDAELNRSSLRIESKAKQIGAFDTGWMTMNIYSSQTAPMMYRVTSPVEYSIYLEFGTRKMMAQPFIYPAVQEEFPILMSRLQKIVKG